MVKRLAMAALVASVLVLAGGPADAGLISSSQAATVGPYDLTTMGTVDWVGYQGSGFTFEKKNTTSVITLTIDMTAGDGPHNFGGPTITWSDGTPDASGSTSLLYLYGPGQKWGSIIVGAPAPGSGNYELNIVFSGTSDQGAGGGSVTATCGADTWGGTVLNLGPQIFTFEYTGAPISVTLQGGYLRPAFQFATLSAPEGEIPEPATLLLVGTGALGVFGVIRRRMMK